MIVSGILLSVIFVAVALLAGISARDKAKGIGVSIMTWLYFALLFDAIVLFLFFQFSEYPIEQAVVILSAFSPIDMCRILILLQLDVAAMMGFTGAIFKDLFGTQWGLILAFGILLLWVLIPYFISLRIFSKRDM